MVGKKTVLGVSEQDERPCETGARRLDWSVMGALCQAVQLVQTSGRRSLHSCLGRMSA